MNFLLGLRLYFYLLFAALGRSSLAQSRKQPEMAARARPGATTGSKWPLEPAQEPQNARQVLIESALEKKNARWVALEPAPESQNTPQVPLEPTWNCRVPDGYNSKHYRNSKSTARAHSHEVLWLLALEITAPKIMSAVLMFFAWCSHQ